VPETRSVLTAAIREVKALAEARGVTLDADIVDKTMAFMDGSDPGIKTSMQRDVEAGRVTELESMIGYIVHLGQESNVQTPVMGFAYAMLKPGQLRALENL